METNFYLLPLTSEERTELVQKWWKLRTKIKQCHRVGLYNAAAILRQQLNLLSDRIILHSHHEHR